MLSTWQLNVIFFYFHLEMGKCHVRRCNYDNCFDMSICNGKENILSWLATVTNSNLYVQGKYNILIIISN